MMVKKLRRKISEWLFYLVDWANVRITDLAYWIEPKRETSMYFRESKALQADLRFFQGKRELLAKENARVYCDSEAADD